MIDSGNAQSTEDIPQVGRQSQTFLPRWYLLLFVLAVVVIVLFQKGTPVDQALANAFTILTVIATLGVYGIWFFWRGPAGVGLKRLVLRGGLACMLLCFSLIRINGVTGQLLFDWSWRWEGVADENLSGIMGEIIPGDVDLNSVTDRLDYPGFLGRDRHPFVEAEWTVAPSLGKVKELWRREIGAGWSAFASVAGFGVTMEQRGKQEIVSCYDLDSGEIRWAHVREFRHETLLGGVGPRATPTVFKGQVYTLGPDGKLMCLAGETGELLWQQDVLAYVNSSPEQDSAVVSWGRSSSPLVVDDLVIVPAGGPQGGPFVSLLAFNRKVGDLVWQGGAEQISFASPTLLMINGERQIVVVNESSVAGHELNTGKQIWKQPWDGSSTSSANNSQPFLVGKNQVFVAKGYGQGAMLFTIDGEKTSEVWRSPSVARTKYTNAVLVDGKIYSLSDGILECADLRTGERIWKKGRFNHGQLLMVGDLILVQSEEGELHFIRPKENGFETVYQVQALEDRCWATMTLYDNKLILRNSEEVVCYQVPIVR